MQGIANISNTHDEYSNEGRPAKAENSALCEPTTTLEASSNKTTKREVREAVGAMYGRERELEQRALSKVPYPSSCRAFLPTLSCVTSALDKLSGDDDSFDSSSPQDDFTLTKQRMQMMRKSNSGLLKDEGLSSRIEASASLDPRRGGQWDCESESDDESNWSWVPTEKKMRVLNKCM